MKKRHMSMKNRPESENPYSIDRPALTPKPPKAKMRVRTGSVSEVNTRYKSFFKNKPNSSRGKREPETIYPNRIKKFRTPGRGSVSDTKSELEFQLKRQEEYFLQEISFMQEQMLSLKKYAQDINQQYLNCLEKVDRLNLEKELYKYEYAKIVAFFTDFLLQFDLNLTQTKQVAEKLKEKEKELEIDFQSQIKLIEKTKAQLKSFAESENSFLTKFKQDSLRSTAHFQNLTDEEVLSSERQKTKSENQAIALRNYSGGSNNISFVAGDRIQILENLNDGYLIGKVRNKKGKFPESYVIID